MIDSLSKIKNHGKEGASLRTVSLRTYALPKGVPPSLKFSAHTPKFLGLDPAKINPYLLWGVNGTASLNSSDSFASRDAQRLGRRLYQIELNYQLDGMPAPGATLQKSENYEYLHLSRITSEFRESLRENLLQWLYLIDDPRRYELIDLELDELVKMRPMFVHYLFEKQKQLKIFVHPVLLPGGVSLRIATVRNIPSQISRVFTRYHGEVETSV